MAIKINPGKILSITLVLAIAVFIRILYFLYSPEVLITPDSHGYYVTGQYMLKSGIYSSHSRPPAYSIFLNLPFILAGENNIPILSQEFFRLINIVVLVQVVLAITGLYILYTTLRLLNTGKSVSCLFTLFTGTNIMLFLQERALLTENIAVFLVMAVTYMTVKILKNPGYVYFFFLFLLFTILFLLKPLYAALPFAILPFIIYYHRKIRSAIFSSLLVLSAIAVIIFTYIQSNARYENYPGLSRIGDIDLLGQILYFNIPVEAGRSVSFFYNSVNDFREKGAGNPMPFRFIEYYDPAIYDNTQRFRDMTVFNRNVILANIPLFTAKSLSQIPMALMSGNDLYSISAKSGNYTLASFFNLLFSLYQAFQIVGFILIPSYILLFFRFILRPSLQIARLFLIGTIAVFHVVLTVPFVYYDFGRLLSPAWPQIYLFSLLTLGYAVKIGEGYFKKVRN